MKSLVIFMCLLLANCAMQTTPPSWSFYDQCAQQTSSFLETAACGKTNRNAYCRPNNTCSAAGNAFVAYTDSLAKSVKNHQMTEDEAQRKWIEFRMTQANAAQQHALQSEANQIMAMPSPVTCHTYGTVTNCF